MFRRAAACALIAALTSVAWLGLLLDVSFDLRTKLGSDGRASVADALSSYALAGPAVVAVFAPRPGTPARSTAAVMVCSWWLAHASAALHSAHKGLLSYIADHAGINAALVFLLVTPTSSGRGVVFGCVSSLAWASATALSVAEACGAPLDTFEQLVPSYHILIGGIAASDAYDVGVLCGLPRRVLAPLCGALYASACALAFCFLRGAVLALPTALAVHALLHGFCFERRERAGRGAAPRVGCAALAWMLCTLLIAEAVADRRRGSVLLSPTTQHGLPHWAWHVVMGAVYSGYTFCRLHWPL